ncbi:MAG: M28 family peptidase [Gemmatimonadaceae bacterium]
MAHGRSLADIDPVAARDLVRRLSVRPRFANSSAETDARNICAGELRAVGFDVAEEPFAFSEFPGRWAPSLGAVILSAVAFASAHAAAAHSAPAVGLSILVGGLALLGLGGSWTARYGTTRTPWLRSQSANLVARRGGTRERPTTWMVAHIDSKSQTVPMLARIASVVLSIAMFALLIVVIGFAALNTGTAPGSIAPDLAGQSLERAISIISWLAIASTIPMILCIVGNRSPGALDNASGVAAVLLAAGLIDANRHLGVVITSAEELGLAGARAHVAMNPGGGTALNCDTIDDRGAFIGMTRGMSGRSALAEALTRAAATRKVSIRIRGMLPGVFADNVAFTDAGWDSLTLSRGNIATLARVHTAGDRPDDIDGAGIAEAARLLAATIEELS